MSKAHLRKEYLLALVLWLGHPPNFEKYWYEASMGAGITPDDEAAGVYTMDQKLESMCPWYSKMDTLFGAKVNIDPLSSLILPARRMMSQTRITRKHYTMKKQALVGGPCSPPSLRAALDSSLGQFLVSSPLAQTEFLAESLSNASPVTSPDKLSHLPSTSSAASHQQRPVSVKPPAASRKFEVPTLNSSPTTATGAAPRNAIACAIKMAAKAKATGKVSEVSKKSA
ncbi:hypothetical protein GQ600_17604 [Phytophthora cactorum]|nr:hypothetical protein GQ600_17604 [Phytophthora cactorum]